MIMGGAVGLLVGLAFLSGALWFATLVLIGVGFYFLNRTVVTPMLIEPFQEKVLPWIMDRYRGTLRWVLQGARPYLVIAGMVVLFVVTIVITAMFGQSPVFFPSSEPNYGYVYIKMPIRTAAQVTVVSNVGIGAGDPQNPDRTITPHKGKVTVAFKPYAERGNPLTSRYLTMFREAVADIPGAEIVVDKESNGPPQGKDVNIEIAGDDFDELTVLSRNVYALITDSLKIPGIERLKSDLERNKPEISVVVDREKANAEGITSSQVGMALRSALYGVEASKLRVGEDEYPIQVRVAENTRDDIDAILNLPITYRDMSTFAFRQVPVASIAKVEYSSTFSGVNRKNQQRVVTLSSNVLKEQGFNPTDVNRQIQQAIDGYPVPEGYTIRLTGAQEEQQESADFLTFAFGIAAMIILLIMVTQFNSIAKPIMIMSTVLFSVIGVLLGFVIFQLQFSVVITGVGIVALGGIVVRNGIVLVDFTDVLLKQGWKTRQAMIEGGAIRFNPVLLTAASTILGLIPLAIGLNLDFMALLNLQDPHLHIGSDSVAFWGPLAWSIIFGLGFSTFLTLVVVPCLYFVLYGFQIWWKRRTHRWALADKNSV